jgi:glutamate racemase
MKIITNKIEREERLDICKGCEHYKLIKNVIEVCGTCNCPLATKTALVLSKCPLNKWVVL